jgi:hypothetical protein
MKKLYLAAGLLAISTSAFAADMPLKAPLAPPPPAMSWSGCYVDGGVGYGLWNQRHTTNTFFPVLPGTTIEQDDGGRGWLGRVGVGCDYQVAPRWVIGVLGQYDFMGLKGTNSPLEVLGGFPISAQEKERSAWYAGGRIGYVLAPSVLTYLDAGWTSTRFNSQVLTTNLGVATGFGYNAQNYSGVFLGSGFETSLADWLPGLPNGLFLRSEYRFSWYGQKTIPEITLATGLPDGNSQNTKPYVQTVTTELVWKFNMFNWH